MKQLIFALFLCVSIVANAQTSGFYEYNVPANSLNNISLHWKDASGEPIGDFSTLKKNIDGKKLVFAMNAGIYTPARIPEGLYIEDWKTIRALNLENKPGNFYTRNAVFFVTERNKAYIVSKQDFSDLYKEKAGTYLGAKIRFATQSGPTYVENGEPKGLDNGDGQSRAIVCIKDNGSVSLIYVANSFTYQGVAVKSNMQQLSAFLKNKMHCQDALHMDGNDVAVNVFPYLTTGSAEPKLVGILTVTE